MYCSTQEEYNKLVSVLYKSHLDYLTMVGHIATTSIENSDQPLTLIEETAKNSDNKRVIDYLEKFDKGEGIDIDVVLVGAGVTESLITDMSAKGDIFEVTSGRIKVLK